MASVEATPDARTAAVTLNLSTVYGVSGILRSDVNGTRPVRLPAGALDGSGPRTVVDYEPALSGLIQYRLQHNTAPGDVWTELSGADLPRFHLPAIPQFSVTAEAVTAYSATRASRSRFHDVIGRSSPLVVAGRMATRAGTLEAVFGTYGEAEDLIDVLGRGDTVMYRQKEHPGLDMYFHPEDLSVTADPGEVPGDESWTLTIRFREVAFPPGGVTSRPEWSFDALAGAYPTFDDVAQRFETFHDLTIGLET